MPAFSLVSTVQPRVDQPRAIAELVAGLNSGEAHQVLLRIKSPGKTFSVANVVNTANRPTPVIAPNKTLAARCTASWEVFSDNAVESLVSC